MEELRAIKEEYEIEFILITHGHTDHYSGIVDILNFASAENIQIGNVASTLNPVIFPYLQITLARSEKLQLVNLTETINAFHEKGLIESIYPIYDSISQFDMGRGFTLNCLFPKHKDYTKIGNIVQKYANKEVSTKPDLNNIASIFRLDFSEGIILFTSDAPVHALNSLIKELNDVTCFLVQVPHHGSEKNHSNAFWSSIKKNENCPAVISCGTSIHSLPDLSVVNFINKRSFEIHSTNYINGIKEYVEGSSGQSQVFPTDVLDTISYLESTSFIPVYDRFNGDKTYSINKIGGVSYHSPRCN